MNDEARQPAPVPPPLPTQNTRGRAFAVASIVIAGIGVLPMLVYLFILLTMLERTGNAFLFILMALAGFFVHIIGLVLGITGMAMGDKASGLFGSLANGLLLAGVLVLGFVGLALS